MSLDLKRQLVAQLVESSRLLRNYIDHRAKGRGTTRAATDVLKMSPLRQSKPASRRSRTSRSGSKVSSNHLAASQPGKPQLLEIREMFAPRHGAHTKPEKQFRSA